MKTYDNTLVFLNRILYSFRDGTDLWKQFENDVTRMIINIQNSPIQNPQFIYDYLYNCMNKNKLLTKYTLCCCTQAALADVHYYLQSKLPNHIIGECEEKSHMIVNILHYEDKLKFIIKKQLCSHHRKNEIWVPGIKYNITIAVNIYKNINHMLNSLIETTIVRISK